MSPIEIDIVENNSVGADRSAMSINDIGHDVEIATSTPATPATLATLPTPEPERWAAEAFVADHLGRLVDRRGIDLPESSSVYRGGQRAAEAALAAFDVADYATRLSAVYPEPRRTVSGLSPWIRHGLLDLPRLWDDVADGPPDDVRTFRGALLWQEYARHRYARRRPSTGPATDKTAVPASQRSSSGRGWDRQMGCVELPLEELEEDGWLVDPARRWLAVHWLGRDHDDPDDGEEHFFRHLLDGSRAANRLGWQRAHRSVVTRWDVEEHAPGLCASCELVADCPIEQDRPLRDASNESAPSDDADPDDPILHHDADVVSTTGPRMSIAVDPTGAGSTVAPEAVWLTAESLGDGDPALAANPDLPAVFVFDEPLLANLRLSSKRLVFLVETLGDLATRRPVEVYLGDPVEVLAGRPLAATFTPVPGWRRRSAELALVELHPWRWLRSPHGGDVSTFEGWRAASHS
ncbi:MAG: hypothetical protein ACR2QO_29055, partial [Acidimicrobiales bacterium]